MHGEAHHDQATREAELMIRTGMARVYFWGALELAFLIGLVLAPLHIFVKLFALVAFTASISTISLIETAWGQVAASKAQLAAARAHHDAEAGRREAHVDVAAIERDLADLAAMQPCPEAEALAAKIRAQVLGASPP